jgi:hypothetical protein
MAHPGNTQEELSAPPLMRILGDFANSQILDAAIEYATRYDFDRR